LPNEDDNDARTTSLLLELRGATAAREKEGTVTAAEERAAIAPALICC
jgi:hypothetical protein